MSPRQKMAGAVTDSRVEKKRFKVKRQLQKQITRTDGHARRVTLPDGGDSGGKDARVGHSARIVELMRENPKISVSAVVSAIGGGKNQTMRFEN